MPRVAILAGGGQLPLMIAASVVQRGGTVHVVAIEGEADPAVAAYPHTWVNYGQARRMMRALKGDRPPSPDNIMVIAGAVTRPDIASIRPDVGLLRLLPQVLRLIRAGGDDALLTRVIRLYESEGLHVSGVQDVAPELLIGPGQLGAIEMNAAEAGNLALADAVLATLGDLDVGQAVVAADGRIIAIEGVEGTDRMLARAAGLHREAGARAGVLLKLPKPGQERRVDLPAIGPRTVLGAISARLAGIAVSAGATLALERDELIRTADAAGLFVAGLPAEAAVAAPPAAPARDKPVIARVLGRHQPSRRDQRDCLRGADAVTRLAAFGTGDAAAVVRGHILAIAAAEGALAMTARVTVLGQWGLQRFNRRRGAIVVRQAAGAVSGEQIRGDQIGDLVQSAATAGFAGIALCSTGHGTDVPTSAIRRADEAGIFLLSVVCYADGVEP